LHVELELRPTGAEFNRVARQNLSFADNVLAI
jgi:hypothetical protein